MPAPEPPRAEEPAEPPPAGAPGTPSADPAATPPRGPVPPPRPDLLSPAPSHPAPWFPAPPHPAPAPRRRSHPGRTWGLAAALLTVIGVTFVADGPRAEPPRDVLITDDRTGDTYVRADGQPSAITDLCGSSRQEQEEPSVAVDPHDPEVVAVGANDGCGTRFGSQWMGFYRSSDGGGTWNRSLVPGFAQDTSEDGTEAPVHGLCEGASDPALAFDRSGTLFYEFICFGAKDLGHPSIYVARYADDGARYDGMVTVRRSDSTGFEDKPAIAVDTTGTERDGSIYTAWTDFGLFGGRVTFCQSVFFSRSTDRGRTYSKAVAVSGDDCGSLADVAVGPRGGVDVVFRSDLKIMIVSSDDGGETFSRPITVANIHPFDGGHFEIGARLCGDGPAHCVNGLTFPRSDTVPAVAVDAGGVHVAWTALDHEGRGRIFVKTSPDFRSWGRPAVQVRPEPAGHQWMPDIATDGDHLDVAFLDSRDDPAFAPKLPPGETEGGANSGDWVQTYLARSTDGGRTWTEQRLSAAGSNPNWETSGSARVPFYGDYLSLSIAAGRGFAAWPDSRDLVPGRDSRETGEADDGDGFDVYLPCRWIPNNIQAPEYSLGSDTCLTAGGMDLNVYGAPFDP